MNLDSASTSQQGIDIDSHNSLIDLHDSSSQHHGSSTTSLSTAIHPQHSQEYVKAMRHLTESMKRTDESRSQVIKMLKQSASAATTTPAATVIPEVPQVVGAPIAVTPPPLGMDIDCGDSIMDDDEMEDDMMWFIDDPITTEKFEPLPPLTKQHDQELSRQQQPQQPSADLSRPSNKGPSLKYIKLAQFLNGSRGTLTDGLQESRKQLGYEVVWIKNQQCDQIE